jgi:hypothetical protein
MVLVPTTVIAIMFTGLLLVALAAAVLSSVLLTRWPPLKRASITAAAAWVLAALGLHFLPATEQPSIPAALLMLLPFTLIVWGVMWRAFALYWRDDAELEAEAAAAAAMAWPEIEREDAPGPGRAPAPERPAFWFVRHWRGEYPLGVAYWVNSLLVVFLATVLAGAALRGVETAGAPLQAVAAGALLLLLLSLLFWGWGVVGTWRSATYHEDRGGSGSWAIAAQVMVVIGIFFSFLQVRNYAFQTIELGTLALGGDSLRDPAQVTLSEDGTEIVIDGTLTSGTSGRFRQLAADAPRLKRVTLDSPGGRQLEAARIAASVEERGLETRVERECMSACTFVLLAGAARTADPDARIGFHQPDFPGWSGAARRQAAREMGEDYVRAGLGRGFVERAMAVPPDDIWLPRRDELLAARVLTASAAEDGDKRPRIQRVIWKLADRLSAGLPVDIGPTTRFDSAAAYGATLFQFFTIRRRHEEIDRPATRGVMGPAALRQVCAVEANRDAIEDGANFIFFFRDQDGRPLFQINVAGCGAV